MDEENLEASLVGGFESRSVEIVEYDPTWPRLYETERALLSEAFGEAARRIEHIGSTAVPGLDAKPVVDVLVTVDRVEEHAVRAAVEPLGFQLRVREPGHLAFRRPDRSVNLHIYADDDPEVRKYLAFRDHLRRDTADRELYARTKRDLAKREWRDINFYADAKTAVITEILTRAETE